MSSSDSSNSTIRKAAITADKASPVSNRRRLKRKLKEMLGASSTAPCYPTPALPPYRRVIE